MVAAIATCPYFVTAVCTGMTTIVLIVEGLLSYTTVVT